MMDRGEAAVAADVDQPLQTIRPRFGEGYLYDEPSGMSRIKKTKSNPSLLQSWILELNELIDQSRTAHL
jgi:hypothetical protein